MLRFLTQKLRTQSLNEVDQPFQDSNKSDDERDSGTESDDENTELEDCTRTSMDNDEDVGGSIKCGRGAQERRRSYVASRRAMDTSSSSGCHSRCNGNDSDDEEETTRPLEKKGPSPVLALLDVDSALPSDSDHFEHHSSEEELEGINNSSSAVESVPAAAAAVVEASGRRQLRARSQSSSSSRLLLLPPPQERRPGTSCGGPPQSEKRKWSQANGGGPRTFGDSSAGSSDDEVRDLMCSPTATPVEFRTSPPADLLVRATSSSSSSAPAKLFHFSSSNFTPFEVCSVSPRKRHRQMAAASATTTAGVARYHHHRRRHHQQEQEEAGGQVQRPCLDFEKMQQMRDRAVSGWRTNRELSLTC